MCVCVRVRVWGIGAASECAAERDNHQNPNSSRYAASTDVIRRVPLPPPERWDVHGTEAELSNGETSWSVSYDYKTDTYRPLTIKTNLFCAGGMLLPDGRLAAIGGAENHTDTVGFLADGFRAVRLLSGGDSDDWIDPLNPTALLDTRWYPTVVMLPEGRLLVMGGSYIGVEFNAWWSNTPTFEFLPRRKGETSSVPIQFLWDTLPANLYPIMYVLPSGRVFTFASYKATFGIPPSTRYFETARLPGGPFRSYPWTGFGAMLPLDPANNYKAQVLVCGGSMLDCGWDCNTFDCQQTCQSSSATTLSSCGLIDPEAPWSTSANASGLQPWDMTDSMPYGRVMGDLLNLPDGSILLINGAGSGMAGANLGKDATLEPLLYLPHNPAGSRWQKLSPTSIPRVYHSTAVLLPDGRVLVAGSSPNDPKTPDADLTEPNTYSIEHRVEYFSPPYLTAGLPRPVIQSVSSTAWTAYNASFSLSLANIDAKTCPLGAAAGADFSLVQPGFRTHSTGHGQRMIWLAKKHLSGGAPGDASAGFGLLSPPAAEIAPPGWYMLFATCGGVPSEAVWVQVGGDPGGFAGYTV
ncbi:glyoxal oxidase N-terminus-domain-containing protein [Zopfochytrium polystomum]|nr:glyoxal oxidase N-terminus-domain-containing protein [Zopfochytrium polystomum]